MFVQASLMGEGKGALSPSIVFIQFCGHNMDWLKMFSLKQSDIKCVVFFHFKQILIEKR